MDFGAVGLEGFVGSDNTISGFGSDRAIKYGSGILKQERSDAIDDDWRSSKLLKTTESMLIPQSSDFLKSNSYTSSSSSSLFPFAQQQQQMLSFSCPKSEAENIPQNLTLPGFHLISQAYSRTAGCGYEGLNAGNMHGVFTAPQWMELQHQALIYKYITVNVPIPSNLLNPIKRALDSSTFSAYSGGLLRPNTLSWGGFHLGFSSNADPEPGRCRRTDGKKWRCSRDAVADQKYCEKHMNRGRHRSRKHVEGQSGHSAAASKPPPVSAAVGLLGGGASGVAHAQQQLKNLQSDNSSNLSAATSLNRMFLSKENSGERVQDSTSLPSQSNANLKSTENPFLFPKQPSPFQESPQPDFGQVNSDSLLNPCKNFNSSDNLTEHQNLPQNSIHQFMDNWPQLDGQTDRTQLSISIPAAPTDFMSSTSFPNTEKPALSPSRVSCDLDLNAFNQRQANWSPVPWETSMGGPLGEVLHSGNNSGSECKSSYSPTGVLQKPTFGSFSNSSAGSSPRADLHRASDGASLCCEFLAPV